MYKNIEKYNRLWAKGEFKVPLAILIGGAAGTGKSTLAMKLQRKLPHTNVLSTTIFRTVLKQFISFEQNPHLYQHTFDLYPGEKKQKGYERQLSSYYEEQSKPIMTAIQEFIRFLTSEKQNYIIEGSNIIPFEDGLSSNNVILINFYLYVSDENLHKRMFSGPTHNREISDAKFSNLRSLNNYVVTRAKELNKKIFDADTDLSEVLSYIDMEIGKYLNKYMLTNY